MLKAIEEVIRTTDVPLVIDTSNPLVMEAALRIYPGRALINSISLESEKTDKLLPLAKKYGAMFILLPISDSGLPKNTEERIQIVHEIINKAYETGLTKEDIIVDGLVTTVGAIPKRQSRQLTPYDIVRKSWELGLLSDYRIYPSDSRAGSISTAHFWDLPYRLVSLWRLPTLLRSFL